MKSFAVPKHLNIDTGANAKHLGENLQEHVASRQLPGLLTARLYHACAAYTVDRDQVLLALIKIEYNI